MDRRAILLFFPILISFTLILGCVGEQQPAFQDELGRIVEEEANQTAQNQTNITDFMTEPGSVATVEYEPEIVGNLTNVTENVTAPSGPLVLNDTRMASSSRIGDGTFGIEYQPDSPLYIYFINVSFGDAILVRKGSFAMIVDAGDADHGPSVASFISRQNISRLQVAVATYPTAEHIGGLPSVIRAMPVDELWDNEVRAKSEEYNALFAETYDAGMPIKWPYAGEELEVNGLRIITLNPQATRFGTNPETDAIVLMLRYKDFCALLLSDAPEELDPLFMSEIGLTQKCDVVKLTSHGSGRSTPSQLIDRISPKAAVISVGTNTLGLPKSTTIARMQIANISLYRTDSNGTIMVYSNGTGFNVTTAINATFLR